MAEHGDLSVEFETHRGSMAVLVRLSGPLTRATRRHLRDIFFQAITILCPPGTARDFHRSWTIGEASHGSRSRQAGGSIVLDLGKVPIAWSGGLAELITQADHARRVGVETRLAAPNQEVGAALCSTALWSLLEVHSTVAEALRASREAFVHGSWARHTVANPDR